MKDEFVNKKNKEKRQTSNKEDKCGEEEEEGKLTKEFEAQASVFLPSFCFTGVSFVMQ